MNLIYTKHCLERMEKYKIRIQELEECISHPDSIVNTCLDRKIYQKRLNGHILRAIVEESKEIKRIITTYKSRRQRYGI